jgi:Fic family protein
MADLVRFCERTDLSVLVHAALAHAQFETIHPFADGNGRTGRALVHALLKRGRATTRLTVPVSAGLLVDTESYFDALTAYRRGDAAPIVQRFSQAAFAAVSNGRRLDTDLADVYAEWENAIRARRDAAIWRVLPLLVSQPAVTVRFIQEAAGVSQPTSQNAIDQLVTAGVLTPAGANRRNRVWIATDVIAALDDFAARVGRRG